MTHTQDGRDLLEKTKAIRSELDAVFERWRVPHERRGYFLLAFGCAELRAGGLGWNAIVDQTRIILGTFLQEAPTAEETPSEAS